MAFSFSASNKKEIKRLIGRYPTKQSALLPILRLVEEQEQAITEDAMAEVAKQLDLPPSVVLGVFTFYTHYRRPGTGKFLLQICSTLPCALCGSRLVEDAIKDELGIGVGETTDDGMFTLMKVECLGSCDTAPVVQINEDYHEGLTPDSIREIIRMLGKKTSGARRR
jgi:NADH dehydrogenase (ubiquinone) flavoprotein 2